MTNFKVLLKPTENKYSVKLKEQGKRFKVKLHIGLITEERIPDLLMIYNLAKL